MFRKDGLLQPAAARWPPLRRSSQRPAMEIVRITDEERRIVEPEWLVQAESVHRQLRTASTQSTTWAGCAGFSPRAARCASR